MKNYAHGLGILLLSGLVNASPMNVYRGVDRMHAPVFNPHPTFNHHPNPVFNHQAPKPLPRYAYRDPRYISVYPHQIPQYPHAVVVNTPHVEVYLQPEIQHTYQHTEEIYLPHGGTYRSTTEYVPQYAPPRYPAQRRVLIQGQYYLDE